MTSNMSQNTSPSQVNISYTIPQLPLMSINEKNVNATIQSNCSDNMINFKSGVNANHDTCKTITKENKYENLFDHIVDSVNNHSVDDYADKYHIWLGKEHNVKRETKNLKGKLHEEEEEEQKYTLSFLWHNQENKESSTCKENCDCDYQKLNKCKQQQEEEFKKEEFSLFRLPDADRILTPHHCVRKSVVVSHKANNLTNGNRLCDTSIALVKMHTQDNDNCITDNTNDKINNDENNCEWVIGKTKNKENTNEMSFTSTSEHNYSFAETSILPPSNTIQGTHTNYSNCNSNSDNCLNMSEEKTKLTTNAENLRRVPSIFMEATKLDAQTYEYENKEVTLGSITSLENWEFSQTPEQSMSTESEEGNEKSSKSRRVFNNLCENSTSAIEKTVRLKKYVTAEKELPSQFFNSELLWETQRLSSDLDISVPMEKENYKSVEATQEKEWKHVNNQIVWSDGQENNLVKNDDSIVNNSGHCSEFDSKMMCDSSCSKTRNQSFTFEEPTEHANLFVKHTRLLNVLDSTSTEELASVETVKSKTRKPSRESSPLPSTSLYCPNNSFRKQSYASLAGNKSSAATDVNAAVTNSITISSTTTTINNNNSNNNSSVKTDVFTANGEERQNVNVCDNSSHSRLEINYNSNTVVDSSSYESSSFADCTLMYLPPNVEDMCELANSSTDNVKNGVTSNYKKNKKWEEQEQLTNSRAVYSSTEVCQVAANKERTVTTLVTRVRTKNGMMRVFRGSWSNDLSLDSKQILPTVPETTNIKSPKRFSRVTSSALSQSRQTSLSPTPYSISSCEALRPVNESQNKTTSFSVNMNENTNDNDSLDDHNLHVKNVLYRKHSFEQSLSFPSVLERDNITHREKRSIIKSDNAAAATWSNYSHNDSSDMCTFMKKNDLNTGLQQHGNTGMMWRLLSFRKQDDGPIQEKAVSTHKGQVGVKTIKKHHDFTTNKAGKHKKDKIKDVSNQGNDSNKNKHMNDHKKKKKSNKKTKTKISSEINKNNKVASDNNKTDAEMSELQLLEKQQTSEINMKQNRNRKDVDVLIYNNSLLSNDCAVNANIHMVDNSNSKNSSDNNKCNSRANRIVDIKANKGMSEEQLCNLSHSHTLSFYSGVNNDSFDQNVNDKHETSTHICTPLECETSSKNIHEENACELKFKDKFKHAKTANLNHHMETRCKMQGKQTQELFTIDEKSSKKANVIARNATGTYVGAVDSNIVKKRESSIQHGNLKQSNKNATSSSINDREALKDDDTSSKSELHLSVNLQENTLQSVTLPPLTSEYNVKKRKLSKKELKEKSEEKTCLFANKELNRSKRLCSTTSNELMMNNCAEVKTTCKSENVQVDKFVLHGVTQRRVTTRPIKSAAEVRSNYSLFNDKNTEINKPRSVSMIKNQLRPLTSAYVHSQHNT